MKKIWKVELEITDEQSVKVPYESKILKVAEQAGKLMMWYLFDDKHQHHIGLWKTIRIVGTGHEFESESELTLLDYIDSVPMSNGLVWHVFQEIDKDDF